MDILGLGTYAIDIIKQVDKLPGPDGFCIMASSSTQPGGSGTNVIVQAARLGARCGFLCKVGDDSIGDRVLSSLRQEGVDTTHIPIMAGGHSLFTEIVVDQSGDKFIMLAQGDAMFALRPDEIRQEAFDHLQVLYTDLIPYGAARAALRMARQRGVQTVFNLQVGLQTMQGLGISREDILSALSDVDVFAPCRQGLFDLAGTEDLEACRAFIRQHFKGLLIITLGSQGVVAYDVEDRRLTAPAEQMEVMDTTGAGDSFLGAFMYAHLLEKQPLQQALQFASKCAAYTCTGLGARSSPRLADLADWPKA